MPGLGISMADMLCTEHVYNCIAGMKVPTGTRVASNGFIHTCEHVIEYLC